MSKIICDVCGTSYPETADQCPICGCVRPVEVQGVITDDENPENATGYTYVKGGRFSKSNVRKRLKANPAATYPEEETEDIQEESGSGVNKALVVTALLLLLSIVAVIIYITIRFFGPGGSVDAPVHNTTAGISQSVIECTGLTITDTEITLSKEGNGWIIRPQKDPVDTTDTLVFTSEDESVATVSDSGEVVAVGPGETTIVITCGQQRVECFVVCNFEDLTEDTTEATTEETTEETTSSEYTEADIIFNSRYNPPEATLRSQGETWNCYKGNIPVEEITWKSDDESVATVKDGVVTAVGSGKTTIHAIWGDIDLTCTVRCNFITTPTGIPGSDDVDMG